MEVLLLETFRLGVLLLEAFIQRSVLLVFLLEVANEGGHGIHLILYVDDMEKFLSTL